MTGMANLIPILQCYYWRNSKLQQDIVKWFETLNNVSPKQVYLPIAYTLAAVLIKQDQATAY